MPLDINIFEIDTDKKLIYLNNSITISVDNTINISNDYTINGCGNTIIINEINNVDHLFSGNHIRIKNLKILNATKKNIKFNITKGNYIKLKSVESNCRLCSNKSHHIKIIECLYKSKYMGYGFVGSKSNDISIINSKYIFKRKYKKFDSLIGNYSKNINFYKCLYEGTRTKYIFKNKHSKNIRTSKCNINYRDSL